MTSIERPSPRMQTGKRIYLLSDFHLGAPDAASSLQREKRIVAFLDEAAKDAEEILLLGDLFDFWFEYKRAVPRGHVRLLGKLAEIADRGIPLHLFIGNHDMWIFDYVPSEVGLTLHREPVVRTWMGKKFLIGHGDGLGPGDHGYKFMKQVFRNPVCQWLFARLHPNFGLWLGDFWSGRSRLKSYENDRKWLGTDKEWLVQYCREELKKTHYDYLLFGHRHLPVDLEVAPGSRYINLGDWITWFTYAVFDGTDLKLMKRTGDGPLNGDVRISGRPAV
ncbi:MAG: UDP-2,3-diacylglucosamine diphosphatase [Flavobacteriales bacterium]|nr:UDP-2,3-diacylglucosamine diphosphatase [Flavobacteriales bacterium]